MSLKHNNIYEFEGFRIDSVERLLWYEDEPVSMPPKVLETLLVLVENKGRLMSKEELMDEIWGETCVEERNLTQNIFMLRKLFRQKQKDVKFIETVPRRGYRFVAELRTSEISAEETLAVSHRKRMHITAEGSVSKEELTAAVSEIVGDELRPERAEGPAPNETRRSGSALFGRPGWILPGAVLVVLGFGFALWLLQNGHLAPVNTEAADTTSGKTRSVLGFERLTDSGKTFHPAVSPDKQFVVYTYINKNRYSLHLQNIATGSRTVVVEPTDTEISRPKFSPDGNYIYFRREVKHGGPANAYRVPIFGGSPELIVEGTTSNIGLSPDGNWLAFVRIVPQIRGQQLIVCRTDGSDERVVSTRRDNEAFTIWDFHPAWSPDGKKVLIGLVSEPTDENPSAGGTRLVAMNISDGRSEPVKMPDWNRYLQAEWMPDGKSILFIARETPETPFQIWRVAYPGGEARRITNDAIDYRYLNIAFDAEFLLTTQEKTFYNLWLVPVSDPDRASQLTFTSELRYGNMGISWAPDGRNLVYTQAEGPARGNLWSIDVETQRKRQITFDQNALNIYPRVAPDGRSVIFASNRKNGFHIWQMDLDGSGLRQITDGVGETDPSVSSDGRWLVYASPAAGKALWKKSLTSDEKPVRLVSSLNSNALSPDGTKLVFSYLDETGDEESSRSRYGIIPFEPTEKPEPLDFNPFQGSIAWKQDGSGFFWIDGRVDLNNIWFYSLADGTNRQVTDYQEMRMVRLDLSPDGRTLATARGSIVSNVFKIENF